MEYVLANLEPPKSKNLPVGPNHGGTSFDEDALDFRLYKIPYYGSFFYLI